ncbi:MAG TPA: polysaccharide biosynthesis tyrosine autokinase [Phnomibacter sp.]|nr:polysaccharide biosynthesis tyrosine autokinase [Phnomibacter sp.]
MSVTNNDLQGFAQEQEDTIDIKEWLFRLLRLWPWLISSIILCILSAWLYLRYTEPVYQSKATILIKDEKKGGAGMLDNSMFKELGIGGNGKLVENETEVLRSIDLVEAAVRRENLYIDIRNVGRVVDFTVYGNEVPFMLEIANPDTLKAELQWVLDTKSTPWALQVKAGDDYRPVVLGSWYTYQNLRYRIWPNIKYRKVSKEVENIRPAYEINLYPIDEVALSLQKVLEVQPVSKMASVINLSLKYHHTERTTNILKAIIEIYNQQGLEDKNLITANTMDFLNERLRIVEGELKGVEGRVERFKTSNRITNVSAEAETFLEQAKEIDQQKAEEETKLNMVEALEKELLLNQDNPRLVPSSLGIVEPSLVVLIQRHNELLLRRDNLAERAGARNPALVDLDNSVKSLRITLLDNVRSLKAGFIIALNDVKRQDSRLNSRLTNMPSIEKDLIQISRDRNVKEQLYLFLLQKREESAISLASSVTDTRIIEKSRSLGKVKPKGMIIYLIALVLGLFLPILVLVILDFFDNKVGSIKEVEARCKAPLLGEISHVKKLYGPIQITTDTRTVVAEQLRSIRTAITFTGKGKDVHTILISSHRPGEGKSFTSLNLAASYALLNKKVVILEFDLRKPRVSRYLGLNPTAGISTYLSRDIDLDELLLPIKEQKTNNLFMLPAGPIPPNPAELILGDRMQQMIDKLRERFDIIIIDTPPFSAVTDAILLQRFADISVVVLRQGYTVKEAYQFLNQRLQNNPEYPLYAILNGVGKTQKYNYGTSYGYGYGYGENEK